MKTLILFLTLFLGSLNVFAGPAEDDMLARLRQKELGFFGIDADVRRLLSDSSFEADVRRWFQVVNPHYVEEALQGAAQDDPHPESAEFRDWARRSGLQANNTSQYRMRILMANHMGDGLPSEKGQIYLAYFLRTGQMALAKSLLRIYALDYALFAREISEDPRLRNTGAATSMAAVAQRILAPGGQVINAYAECAGRFTSVEAIPELARCLKGQIRFSVPQGYEGPGHVVSRSGYIGGNDVAYFTDNRHDGQIIGQFEEMYRGKRDPVADLLGSSSIEQLFKQYQQGSSPFAPLPFSDAAIHPALGVGPALNVKAAIFPELVRGIRSAKHTLFVDIFFLGGTMGAAMSNELIRASERGVKVFLLHDPFNAFTYRNEIDPIFRSMLAYGQAHPDRMTVAGSYILAHRSGLPSYFDALFPDAVIQSLITHAKQFFGYDVPLFPKAKSDHSKVMVVDGAALWADSTPVAYVGSKNWTDSSGAMTFDEVARVTGPAAVAVQDAYYWDMWYALRNGGIGRSAMESAAIEATIEPFDVLGRRYNAAEGRVIPTRNTLVNVGAQANGINVRFGENNVDGSIRSVLDQNIQAIRSAKKQIVISDQFLYDRRLIDELLDKARSNPRLMIYIMLEPLSESSGIQAERLGGFPNTLYMDRLKYQTMDLDAAGNPLPGRAWPNIQVKWKHVPHSTEFHMEYHMKTISVDGFDERGSRVTQEGPAILITGSANKDHMTMHGAFREAQVEIYDNRDCSGIRCGAVAEHDRMFWKRWSNRAAPDEGAGSEETAPFRFEVPSQVQTVARQALSRDMTPAEFVLLMRSLIHTAYDLEQSTTVE